jgi:hypothetical protein
MNKFFAKLNLLDSNSLNDIYRFSNLDNSDDNQTSWVAEHWGHADLKYADDWLLAPINYRINKFGFRGEELSNNTDIAAFGCSFTFGTGLSESMLWHNVLAKKFHKSSINFGLPARSIQSIIDMFLIVSKHIKIKDAIFLLPSISRIQIAKTHPTHNLINHLNCCVDVSSALNKTYGINEDTIYRAIPEEEMYKNCKNQLYLLDYISKDRNVQCYVASWDSEVHHFINQLDFKSVIVLPRWESPSLEYANADLARDKHHPGPAHHRLWVDKIKDYIT